MDAKNETLVQIICFFSKLEDSVLHSKIHSVNIHFVPAKTPTMHFKLLKLYI